MTVARQVERRDAHVWNATVHPLSRPLRYASAPLGVLFAGLVELVLLPDPHVAPFVFFYFSVAVTSWTGGRLPGLLSVLLSALTANLFFLEEPLAFEYRGPALTATTLFVVGGSSVSLICSAFRAAAGRARLAEESLRRYQLLSRHSRDVMLFIRREDGRILEANAAAAAAYGYAEEELLRLTIHDLRASASRADIEAQMTQADSRGLLFETAHRRKDGSTFPVEVSSQGATVAGVRMLVSVIRDISERRAAQDALWESSQRLRATFDNAALGLIEIGPGDRITAANDRMCQILGYSREELLEKTVHGLTAPEDRARSDELNAALRQGRVDRFEYEKRYLRRDGAPLWVHVTASAVRDDQGLLLWTIGTVEDISERKRAEETLLEANRRKDEFLALLAHELRNPLAPILNSVQILRRSTTDSQLHSRALAITERQVRQLVRLIDDLLDISRITRGKIIIERQPVTLASMVEHALETSRPQLEAAGHQLTLRLPERPIQLEADPARIAQVLSNMLDNAAKYTPRGGRIEVLAGLEEGEAVVRIRDNGVGIAPDLLPRIFEIFFQADSTLERARGGLGVGLALAKRLVEMHQGRVEVRSAGVGQGSEFIVRLPVLSAEAGARRPAAPAGARPSAPALRVLVVDDNEDVTESMSVLLSLMGHSVQVTNDGPSAIACARASRPDVVLLDIGMPGMNGYEVARALRDGGPSGLALVAITGWGQEEDLRRACEAGFDHHVTKPAQPEELEQLLFRIATEGGRAALGPLKAPA